METSAILELLSSIEVNLGFRVDKGFLISGSKREGNSKFQWSFRASTIYSYLLKAIPLGQL